MLSIVTPNNHITRISHIDRISLESRITSRISFAHVIPNIVTGVKTRYGFQVDAPNITRRYRSRTTIIQRREDLYTALCRWFWCASLERREEELQRAACGEGAFYPSAGEGTTVFHPGAGVIDGGGTITPGDGESRVFDDVFTGGAIDTVGGWCLSERRGGSAGVGVVGVVLGGRAAGVAVDGGRDGEGGGSEDEGEEEDVERGEECESS